jgi:multiple sugar transport system permease protein
MRWTSRVRFLFLAPAVVWVLLFTIFPLGYSLFIAFNKIDQTTQVERVKEPVVNAEGEPVLDSKGRPRTKNVVIRHTVTTTEFVGWTNFKRLFSDPQLHESVRVTLTFVLIAVPAELCLGFLIALLFNRPIMGRSALRAVMILPIFATPIAMGYSFFTIFYEEGGPLAFTGIPWLSDPAWALVSVAIVDIWQWTPFCFLVFLAAMQGVPDELIEAARIDGASGWDILFRVLLPLLQPTIIIVLLIRFAEALKVLDIPFTLTGGGPGVATQTYSFLAFRTGLRFFDLGYASAMAYGLLAIVMVVVLFFFRRLRQSYG